MKPNLNLKYFSSRILASLESQGLGASWSGLKTSQELAEIMGWSQDSAERVIHFLVARRYATRMEQGRFELSVGFSTSSRQEAEQSRQEYEAWLKELSQSADPIEQARYFYARDFLEPLYQDRVIRETLRKGRPQLELAYGPLPSGKTPRSPFDYYGEKPGLLKNFGRLLFAGRLQECQAILPLIPRAQSYLDVGGGAGPMAAAFGREGPKSFEVYDLPEAKEALRSIFLESTGALPRWLKYRGGSFFQDSPSGGLSGLSEADTYDQIQLGLILHDWNDSECVQILRRIRPHLAPNGQLVIFELLSDFSDPELVTYYDLMMLLAQGGRERTYGHYQLLLNEAGYSQVRRIDTPIPRKVLVAEVVR